MTSSFDWQAPIPLGAITTPFFPENVFPEPLNSFVEAVAKSTETPLDLAGVLALAGIGTAVHSKFRVQIKPDYTEPTCIWVAPSLPSGSRKSAVISAIMKPILQFEFERQEELKPIIAERISRNKTIEARLKELRQKIAKDDSNSLKGGHSEILELEKQLEEVTSIPQLWTGDVTPENLATLMMANDGCMAILSDEAGIFDNLGGRYSNGIPNLDLFLKAYSGMPARVNRTGRPPDLLPRAILTIGITPQPEVLKAIGKNSSFRGRGLLGRFLFALPLSNLGFRELDSHPISKEVENEYHQLVKSILAYPLPENGPYTLQLSQEAFTEWRLYALATELQMGTGGQFFHMTDWAGKLPGQIARIAGLIHIVRHADNEPWKQSISVDDMHAAISLGSYFSNHALAVYDLVGVDPALEGARKILKWILDNKWTQFTFRDCQHEHKHRFKKAKDMEPSIEVLIENYYINEPDREKKNGRPSRVIDVNPMLYNQE